jgi:hypothetical protein
LEAALQEAETASLGQHMAITDESRKFVTMLNALYSDKKFEYIETGFKTSRELLLSNVPCFTAACNRDIHS